MPILTKNFNTDRLDVALSDLFSNSDMVSGFSSSTDLIPSVNLWFSIFTLLQSNAITPEYIYVYTPKIVNIYSLTQNVTLELVNFKINNCLSVYNPRTNLEVEISLYKS